ncbi:MAG: RtcB family protein [Deltaproteobacteria bacterium]|nr:RtcB family protein [Deltaproteobacteria bacterium]
MSETPPLEKVTEYLYKIPRHGGMRVDGLVYTSAAMLHQMGADQALQQVANVAHLPGIVRASLAMPDIHWGYGFPIGGVAAMDADEGVISPGGIGFDINCGVRLLKTDVLYRDVREHISQLTDALFRDIPTGLGAHHRHFTLSLDDERRVALKGAQWAIENGYGDSADAAHIESHGRIPHADPDALTPKALERGRRQLGTLGSGNHFVEIGYVDEIYDGPAASVMGLHPGQLTVIIHTGSRGFGYQTCDDYLELMQQAARRYGIDLPDRQLCCAPIDSPEGKRYIGAMGAAANYAFANRQMITHFIREAFAHQLRMGPSDLGIGVVYDVAHNIAKFEEHTIDGQTRRVCVHRKGATRAFPPGHPEIPDDYRAIGQPVLIPGDMGRYSFVLVGQPGAMAQTFGSTCHGAGRLLSRKAATRQAKGRDIERELAGQGITVRGASRGTVVEEMPEAYKDVSQVVDVCHAAGISKKVARLKPVGVIKG